MKKNKIFLVLGVLLVLGVVGGIVAYKMYNKPHKDFAHSQADITTDAKTIFDAFATDENAATQKFVTGDKIIQVSGVVVAYSQENDSTASISLAEKMGEPAIVSCNILPEFFGEAATLEPGKPIVIKGQCVGYQGLIDPAVFFSQCALVQ